MYRRLFYIPDISSAPTASEGIRDFEELYLAAPQSPQEGRVPTYRAFPVASGWRLCLHFPPALRVLLCDTPFPRLALIGQVDEYEVKSEKHLGSIWWLRLEKVKFLVEDDWFCRFLSVKTPSGEELHFPCYRWLSEDDVVFVREGPAKRPSDDKLPIIQAHRQKGLVERQRLYRWKVWKPGVIKCIDAETEDDLHPDVKFDDDKRSDFEHSLRVALGELFLKKFVNMFGSSWDSLESFQRIFWRVKNPTGSKRLEIVRIKAMSWESGIP
ncbi:hypothetical protein scyTo_0022279 [Scyliorhinus torazame]|uniref:Lipoxygenase domain-containing protein n=1 Tax=Scyliorhinus torazame TaxID=75743 RepID=A0A401Q9P9_SCYTO|nr:hypothetical protein [Scyliorhinus torazame]